MRVGIHQAVAESASVWESKQGALMVSFAFSTTTDPVERIIAHQCLFQKDGTASEITARTLKECFGWDGVDPFWLEDKVNLEGKTVELDVIEEEYNGKTYPKVKYINAPGRAGGMPASGNRQAIMNKYGAKLRALAGPQPVRTVAKAAAPVPPPPPAPEPPPPIEAPDPDPEQAIAPATQGEAWAACIAANPGAARKVLEKEWFDGLKEVCVDKSQTDYTPEEWGRVKAYFDTDNVPY